MGEHITNLAASVRQRLLDVGVANSRMKDYYDILTIFGIHTVDNDMLAKAIAATFHRRQTPLPEEVPTGLSDEFGRDPLARRRWPEFLQRLRIEDAPADLGQVVKAIRGRVLPAMQKARGLS